MPENIPAPAAPSAPPVPTPNLEVTRSEGASSERARIREINAIATRLQGRVDGIMDRA